MAGRAVELGEADALHHDLVEVQFGDLDATNRFANGGSDVASGNDFGGKRCGWPGRFRIVWIWRGDRCGRGKHLIKFLGELILRFRFVQARAPELKRHECENEHTSGQECPA